MTSDRSKPEWTPPGGGAEFAGEVMRGVEHDPAKRPIKRAERRELSVGELEAGVVRGERVALARAITLIESNSARHHEQAAELLRRLQPHQKPSIRLGITGVPGAGKSTLIEALGVRLCRQNHKVAVLAVDPSSTRTGGSILGDKTRMEQLAREPNAFIRPSPSGGTLGGVARKSRETMLLCEAAGYDVLLVETVGVGQSEVTVRSMVDMFCLVLIAGGGDELQGIKKGVIELADAILVNKADGDNVTRAKRARAEFARIVHLLAPATDGWTTPSLTLSAQTGDGLDEFWAKVEAFLEITRASGVFEQRRREQAVAWLHALIEEGLRERFLRSGEARERLRALEARVADGSLPVAAAAESFLSR